MKYTKILILLGALLLTVSCKKDDVVAAVPLPGDGGGGTTTKDLFSTNWSVSNNAWEFNYGAGNFIGTPFSSTLTYSFMGTCTCTTTLTGSQTAGSISQACSQGNVVSGVPDGDDCDVYDYGGAYNYKNENGNLIFCSTANSQSCNLTYH